MLLPIAPFTETSGTFVNTEGRVQSFQGVVQPLGETRPAWKVLRVLGNLLGLAGFDQQSAEDVRVEALGARHKNMIKTMSYSAIPALHTAAAVRAAAHRRNADLRGGCDRASCAVAAKNSRWSAAVWRA